MILQIGVSNDSTSNEKEYILDKKYIGTELRSFSFPHVIYVIRETNNTLKSISPET